MKALIWHSNGSIELVDKSIPEIQNDYDAIVKVELSSICTSDIHIIKGCVPQAVPNTTLGHEFVGQVIKVGKKIKNLKPGDRVAANCETFCGECFYCKKGFINNCEKGGWHLGCKIDGCHAEYVRVPYANTGLNILPDNVSYEDALFVGDILSSGYFGADMIEIKKNNTIAVIGAGPVGLCAMLCAKYLGTKRIVAIDIDNARLKIAEKENLADFYLNPKDSEKIIKQITDNHGVDGVIECAGTKESFELSWKIARANSIIGIVAMYEENQILPLPDMYGKNLTFKTGGVDAIHCEKLINLISKGKISTNFLITEKMPFSNIEQAYKLFADKKGLKIALYPDKLEQ